MRLRAAGNVIVSACCAREADQVGRGKDPDSSHVSPLWPDLDRWQRLMPRSPHHGLPSHLHQRLARGDAGGERRWASSLHLLRSCLPRRGPKFATAGGEDSQRNRLHPPTLGSFQKQGASAPSMSEAGGLALHLGWWPTAADLKDDRETELAQLPSQRRPGSWCERGARNRPRLVTPWGGVVPCKNEPMDRSRQQLVGRRRDVEQPE
jgi:hypothetical protein